MAKENEQLDTLLKIKELLKPLENKELLSANEKEVSEIALEENKKELIQLSLVELRRVYDGVLSSLDALRTKALALLAAEVAIVAFLFAPTGRSDTAFFAYDTPVYGVVLFGLGLSLLFSSFVLFLISISSVNVTHPPDEKDIVDIYGRFQNSPLKFLEYLKSEYMRALSQCISRVNHRSKRFTWGVYSFAIGIALLILVKYCSNVI